MCNTKKPDAGRSVTRRLEDGEGRRRTDSFIIWRKNVRDEIRPIRGRLEAGLSTDRVDVFTRKESVCMAAFDSGGSVCVPCATGQRVHGAHSRKTRGVRR